jgi:hypothetical protein
MHDGSLQNSRDDNVNVKYSCSCASHEDIWGSGGTAPCIFNLDTNSSEMLYLQGTSPQNPLNRGVTDGNLTTFNDKF